MNIDHTKIQISEAFGIDEYRMEQILNQVEDWLSKMNYYPKDTQVIEYGLTVCRTHQEELCALFLIGVMRGMSQIDYDFSDN